MRTIIKALISASPDGSSQVEKDYEEEQDD